MLFLLSLRSTLISVLDFYGMAFISVMNLKMIALLSTSVVHLSVLFTDLMTGYTYDKNHQL